MSCELGKVVVDFGFGGFTIEVDASIDGNQFCVLLGENLQDGIAGFGGTLASAIQDFKMAVRNEGVSKQGK